MTQDSPAEDLIRYDVMVQEALLGVVRKVLTDASRQGLPGEHHFYITFRSEAPGVRLSTRLREKYPEEMTVVLQHQFWDLIVNEHAFEVGLSFGGVPERLLVPFEALTGFYDPSVQFGLKFTPDEAQADNDPAPEPDVKDQLAAISTLEKSGRPRRGAASEPKVEAPAAETAEPPAPKKRGKAAAEKPPEPPAEPAAEAPRGDGGAEVVSLEAFRKKK